MARQPKLTENDMQPAELVTEVITYLPGQMDPPTIKYFGHVFHANVPKEITGHADGSATEKLNMQLIETARPKMKADGTKWFHPWFKVGDASRKRTGHERPKTADQYRAHMIAWLQDESIRSTDQLVARFAQDRELQATCEVGADDWAYLATLFMPKLHELAKADELTEGQVAHVWINHGINQLPW